MSYYHHQNNGNYGYGGGGYSGGNYGAGGYIGGYGGGNPNQQYPPPNGPQSHYPVSSYDPVALQMRIVRAKQVNLMCKQNMVRNMILSDSTAFSKSSNGGGSSHGQVQSQPQQRMFSQEEPAQFSNNNLPQLQRDLQRNDYDRSTPIPKIQEPQSQFESFQGPANNSAKASLSKPRTPTESVPVEASLSSHGVTEDEDHSIPLHELEQSTAPLRPREDIKILSSLADNMEKTVNDNVEALKKISAAKKKQQPPAEKVKKKIEQMIKVSDNLPAVMSLWRHKLNGRPNPPPETVLKGARLLRLVTRSLLNFIIKPTLARLRRKLIVRESERKDLQKTMKIIAGGFDDWIGKLVQLPVSSVAQVGLASF
jgi:hypothetical protein